MGLASWLARFDELRPSFILGWLLRSVTWAGAIFAAYRAWIAFAFPGTAWPDPRGTWHAIQLHWISLVMFQTFAVVALTDPAKYLTKRPRTTEALQRSRVLEDGVQRAWLHVKALNRDFRPSRELILRAALIEIESELGIVGKHLIQTNLILADPPNSIRVEARSGVGNAPITYERTPFMMASKAMERNETVVQCHVKALPGFANKEYDCVAATPIAHRDRAYGAVTVDSLEGTTFANRDELIDRILRPYCAMILLTIDKDSGYYPCPVRNPR